VGSPHEFEVKCLSLFFNLEPCDGNIWKCQQFIGSHPQLQQFIGAHQNTMGFGLEPETQDTLRQHDVEFHFQAMACYCAYTYTYTHTHIHTQAFLYMADDEELARRLQAQEFEHARQSRSTTEEDARLALQLQSQLGVARAGPIVIPPPNVNIFLQHSSGKHIGDRLFVFTNSGLLYFGAYSGSASYLHSKNVVQSWWTSLESA
jgi:hypothetical protein